jgi:hypothetical protein
LLKHFVDLGQRNAEVPDFECHIERLRNKPIAGKREPGDVIIVRRKAKQHEIVSKAVQMNVIAGARNGKKVLRVVELLAAI